MLRTLMIPLRFCKLCSDLECDTVYDGRRHRQCPHCGARNAVLLGKWLNRPALPPPAKTA